MYLYHFRELLRTAYFPMSSAAKLQLDPLLGSATTTIAMFHSVAKNLVSLSSSFPALRWYRLLILGCQTRAHFWGALSIVSTHVAQPPSPVTMVRESCSTLAAPHRFLKDINNRARTQTQPNPTTLPNSHLHTHTRTRDHLQICPAIPMTPPSAATSTSLLLRRPCFSIMTTLGIPKPSASNAPTFAWSSLTICILGQV